MGESSVVESITRRLWGRGELVFGYFKDEMRWNIFEEKGDWRFFVLQL